MFVKVAEWPHAESMEPENAQDLAPAYDVVVIGGGAAGLSAALMLGRSRRSVVVIDAGKPRNAPAHAIHGLLGREGMAPSEFLERGRAEVREYGAQVVAGEVAVVRRHGSGRLHGEPRGRTAHDRPATHADQRARRRTSRYTWPRRSVGQRRSALPLLPWLGSARPTNRHPRHGPDGRAPGTMFRQLSPHVTLFAHTAMPDAEQLEALVARDIEVVSGEVVGIEISVTTSSQACDLRTAAAFPVTRS